MTPELKAQKLLECKAAAYDSIVRLHDTTVSHRNFDRLVGHVIRSVIDFKRQLELAPETQSEQFPCMCRDVQCTCHGRCSRDASCQVELRETQCHPDADSLGNVLMCDLCANSALHRGVASIVEENAPDERLSN
jgi:hypothetical protein